MSGTNKLKDDLHRVGQDLKQLADEVRVKLHLAGQEAKDAWSTLEPRLREFEQAVENAGHQISKDATRLGEELKDKFEKLRDKVNAGGKS